LVVVVVRGARRGERRHRCSTSHHLTYNTVSNTVGTTVLGVVALLLGGGDGGGRETLQRHRVSSVEG